MPQPQFDPAKFRQLREAQFTPTELGFFIGRRSRTIQSWEQGFRAPPAHLLVAAARLLNCRVEEFFSDRELVAS